MHEEHSASTALSSAGQDNDRLAYSVAEAARRLDVSRMTLYREIAAGRLAAIRIRDRLAWIHCEDDGRGARSAGLTRGSTGLVPCIGSVGRAGRSSSASPVRRSDLIRAWPTGLIAVLSVV